MSNETGSQTPRIILAWLVVGIPLAYGLSQTIQNAMHIFTG
jgi:hypothetical protein